MSCSCHPRKPAKKGSIKAFRQQWRKRENQRLLDEYPKGQWYFASPRRRMGCQCVERDYYAGVTQGGRLHYWRSQGQAHVSYRHRCSAPRNFYDDRQAGYAVHERAHHPAGMSRTYSKSFHELLDKLVRKGLYQIADLLHRECRKRGVYDFYNKDR